MMLFHVLLDYQGSSVDCRAQPFKNGEALVSFQISFTEGKTEYTDRFLWEQDTWHNVYQTEAPGSMFKRIPSEVVQQIVIYLNEKYAPES